MTCTNKGKGTPVTEEQAKEIVSAIAADLEERGVPEGLPTPEELTLAGAVCVIAYARISSVRNRTQSDGTKYAKGVSNQHVEMRVGATQHKVIIVKRYTDNDASASKDEHRPDYEAMLTDLHRGITAEGYPVHGVICVEEERIFKTPSQWDRFMEAFRSKPGRFFADEYGPIDLYSEAADYIGLIKVATFMGETRKKKARTTRWHKGQARRGIPHTGGRVFGYQPGEEPGTLEIVPEEAALIVAGVEACIAGKSWGSIAKLFQESGIATENGGPWQVQTIKQIVSSPRIAGLRLINGEVFKGEDGEPVIGNWPTMITVEQWKLVTERYFPRQRLPGGNSANPTAAPLARTYLLSGLLRCGKVKEDGRICNCVMQGRRDTKGRAGYVYSCRSKGQGGCGGTAVIGPWIESRVIDAAFVAIEDRPTIDVEVQWAKEDKYQEQITKRDTLRGNWAIGEVTDQQFYPLERLLNEHITLMEKERSAFLLEHAKPTDTLEDMRRKWSEPDSDGAYDLAQKRALIFGLMEAVLIFPVGKGNRKRPEDSYSIVFRQD